MSDSLPPFATPHAADFKQLLHILERTPGFSLQPVDAPSPDLAEAFAHWIADSGWSVEFIVLDTAGLAALPERLTRPRTRPDPCLYLIAYRETSDPALAQCLATLNLARDTIVRQLRCPLLWWGGADFLRTSWVHAPDLWSVAAVPFRMPYRRLQDTLLLPLSAYWWTGAVHTPLPALEGELAEARRDSNSAAIARADLRVAEARLAHKDLHGAAQILDQLKRDVATSDSPLRSRWELLTRATANAVEPAEADIGVLLTKLKDAEDNHHQRRAIGLRLRLASLLESRDTALAVATYLGARSIASELGDLATTLDIDIHLVFDLAQFIADEELDGIRAYAESIADKTADPGCLSVALLIRANLAMMRDALNDAESLAHQAQTVLEGPRPGLKLAALGIFAQVAWRRGEFTTCVDLATDWLALAEESDHALLQLQAHSLRAEALVALNNAAAAAQDLLAAFSIAYDLDLDLAMYLILGHLAGAALAFGDTWVAARLAATATIGAGARGFQPLALACSVDPDALDNGETRNVAACLRAALNTKPLTDDQRPHHDPFAALADAAEHLDSLLKTDGVEETNPASWRVREPRAPLTAG